MINWFPEGGAFITKGEADQILSYLRERGLVGKHDIHADGDGWYYLIVDTYRVCCTVAVTVDFPTPAESMSWGQVKSHY